MIYTAQQIIYDAMSLCGAVAMDEQPNSGEVALGLRILNMMLGSWSSQHLAIRSQQVLTFNLQAGKAAYTIGASGADVTSSKPLAIVSGFVTDSTFDYALTISPRSLYDGFEDKGTTGRPEYVAYDPGLTQQAVHKGTVYFYYTPDQAYPVQLLCDAYLTEFAAATDTVTFEPMYYEALYSNLGARLFRHYHPVTLPVPTDIARLAHDSLTLIKSLNAKPIFSRLDVPSADSTYNVYTDSGG